MKKRISKWFLRISVTTSFIAVLLLTIILKPDFTYAYSVKVNTFTVFHEKPMEDAVYSILNDVNILIQSSELYNPNSHFDICMNDGSVYPALIKKLRGPAFAWGFYDKVVLQGELSCTENTVELNGYKWNLRQLLAHELTHCMQFNHYGWLKSNPIAGIPQWKWEGYAEYIGRKKDGSQKLYDNINLLVKADMKDTSSWEVVLSDGTISPREYYNYFLLMQYCMEVKKWTYDSILQNKVSERELRDEMMRWYYNEDKRN